MPAKEKTRKVQTTVRLPRSLYEQAKCFVDKDVSSVNSINDFVVAAIQTYLKMLRRKRIDAAFAGMAEDANYQKEAQLIAEEFEQSDWEALEIAEEQSEGRVDAHVAR